VGEVVQVGPASRNDDGTRNSPEVSVGDQVLYSKVRGTPIKPSAANEFVAALASDKRTTWPIVHLNQVPVRCSGSGLFPLHPILFSELNPMAKRIILNEKRPRALEKGIDILLKPWLSLSPRAATWCSKRKFAHPRSSMTAYDRQGDRKLRGSHAKHRVGPDPSGLPKPTSPPVMDHHRHVLGPAMVKRSAHVPPAHAITPHKGNRQVRLPRQEDRGACRGAADPISRHRPGGTISAGNDEEVRSG